MVVVLYIKIKKSKIKKAIVKKMDYFSIQIRSTFLQRVDHCTFHMKRQLLWASMLYQK